MSIDDFIAKVRKNLDKIESKNTPLRIAALTAHQQASKRIFSESLDIHGNKITYINPIGARDGSYSLSYAKYRKKYFSRSDTSEVTFNLTGDFESDYMNSTSIAGAEPIKISPNQYNVELRRSKPSISNAELIEVFEDNFYLTTIFTLSKEEKEIFYEVAADEFKKQFQT